MIKAYTRNSARLIQLENKIGSIEVGKQADFVLLDRDVMNVNPMEIKDTKVIWTMVGGEIVFSNQ
jgi:predicted amidohydrolase YtcJ